MVPAVAATAGEIILPIHMGEAPAAETMAEAAAAAAIKAATGAVIRPWAIIAAATTIAETTATAAVARRTAAGTAMIIIPIPGPQDSRRYPVRKPVAVMRNKPIPEKEGFGSCRIRVSQEAGKPAGMTHQGTKRI